MSFLDTHRELSRSYFQSCEINNLFKSAIESIDWEESFRTGDNTTVYVKENYTLEIESDNPFDCKVTPSFLIDMTTIELSSFV